MAHKMSKEGSPAVEDHESLASMKRSTSAVLGHLTRLQREAETQMMLYENDEQVREILDKVKEKYKKLIEYQKACVGSCMTEEERKEILENFKSHRSNQQEFLSRVNDWLQRSQAGDEVPISAAESVASSRSSSSLLRDAKLKKAKAALQLKTMRQRQQLRLEEVMMKQKSEELEARATLEEAEV